jgi:palmitoyltransferase ZDHHC4
MCDICVAGYDHHCIWINQCVGIGNYRYFLAFLICNTTFLLYAAAVISIIVISEVIELDLMNATFYNIQTHVETKATITMVVTYMLYKRMMLVLLILLTSILGTGLL